MPTPAIESAIAAAQSRIRQATGFGWRWMGGYAKTKVATDWVYPRLCEHIEPGATVLDLGSGVGLLGLVLEHLDRGHRTFGIEWDARKVAFAGRLGSAASTVQQGDIFQAPWPETDAVVLVDVLHYFPLDQQKFLLRRVAEHLKTDGVLFLRVMDRKASGRARLTRLLERAAVLFRWNHGPSIHWRTLEEIQADLQACGLESSLCLAGTHLLDGNCLLRARKP